MTIEFSIPGYEIKRELGRGGMAVVYLAIQESFGRDVAIKVLPLINANDESFTERFLREARIVSRLVHPNIVTVYDVGIHQGHHYLSMEFIPGMDLRQAQAKLTRLELVSAVKSVASALDFAGKKGYVHRDVKPENIMLHEEDNRVILMDFGIARGNDTSMSMTATGRAIGTPYYMSPEQTKGKEVDHRSDIYSLGIVLYQMLTGRVPYDADSAVAVGIKHITDPIPVLPQNLRMYQTIINTALAKSPEHRYQTAGELIEALNAIPDSALKMLENEAEDFRMAGLDHNASTIASTDEAAPANLQTEFNDLSQTPPPVNFTHSQQTAVTRQSLTGLKPPESRKRRRALFYVLLAILLTTAIYKREQISKFLQREKATIEAVLTEKPAPLPEANNLPVPTDTKTVVTQAPQKESITEQTAQQQTEDFDLDERINKLTQSLGQNPQNAIQLANIYKQVLRQKPSDPDARQGIKQLRQWYTNEINIALANNELPTARQRVNMLKQSFPRMSRNPRYIKLEQRLKNEEAYVTHLQLAKKYIAFNQYSTPADANAMSELIAANNIHPGNEEIIKLREDVADHYYTEATDFIKQGRKKKAMHSIKTGLQANPNHKELLSLNKALTVRQPSAREVRQKLATANAYYTDEQYFSPAGRNAYDAYRAVLKLDPANKEAKKGLENIKRYWLDIFYEDIRQGDLDDASSTMVKIQERYARDPDIKLAQNKLARALASSQPEITMVHLSTQKMYSLRTPESSVMKANTPVYIGFHYNNFAEVAEPFTLKLIREDNKYLFTEKEINVSGNDGDKFLLLDVSNAQLVAGKYKLLFKIGRKTLMTKKFTLQ